MHSSTNYTVQGLTEVIAIAAGAFHTVVVRRDGTVWTWGRNSSGQLGNGQAGEVAHSPVPIRVPNLEEVLAVAAGRAHILRTKQPRSAAVFVPLSRWMCWPACRSRCSVGSSWFRHAQDGMIPISVNSDLLIEGTNRLYHQRDIGDFLPN